MSLEGSSSRGENDGQGELNNLVGSLTSSQEAMSAIGAAVAEALRRTSEEWQRDGRPIPDCLARNLGQSGRDPGAGGAQRPPGGPRAYAPVPWGAGAGGPAPDTGAGAGFFALPPMYPWPYPWHTNNLTMPSPFDRLGPPSRDPDLPPGGACSSPSVSSRAESGVSPPSEEGLSGDEDALDVHPIKDDFDVDCGQGTSVSPGLESFLKSCVAAPLTNVQRKKCLDQFPKPQVPELRPPRLDPTLKLLVPKGATGHDGWLQKMQALAIDAYAPLVSLLQSNEGGNPSKEDTRAAIRCSLKLMGNLFARLSQERRRKALCAIHKDLGHMAEEDFGSAQSLFGDRVVDRIKARHDALKALRSAKQPFRKGGAQKAGQPGRREVQGQSHLKSRPPFKRPRFSSSPKGKK